MNSIATEATRARHEKQINTSNLSWCDMALLKKQDPFMYYSIPGNRNNCDVLQGKDLDLSDVKIASCPGTRRRSILAVEAAGPKAAKGMRRTTFTTVSECKQQVHEVSEKKSPLEPEESHPNIVKRKSAISFESCAELDDVIEELTRLSPIQVPDGTLNSGIASVQIDATRRGSVLQDILFNSIGNAMEELGEVDLSDSDDEN